MDHSSDIFRQATAETVIKQHVCAGVAANVALGHTVTDALKQSQGISNHPIGARSGTDIGVERVDEMRYRKFVWSSTSGVGPAKGPTECGLCVRKRPCRNLAHRGVCGETAVTGRAHPW